MNCETKERDGFCPACDIAEDIRAWFKELLLPQAYYHKGYPHRVYTVHADAIKAIWLRVSEQSLLPYFGIASYVAAISYIEVEVVA